MIRKIKLKLLVLALVLLSGCGSNIPDCADASILEDVKALSTDIYKKRILSAIKREKSSSYMGMPIRRNSDISFFLGAMSAAIKDEHFDITPNEVILISNEKYDKELPKRECSATVTFNAKLAQFPEGSEDARFIKNVIGKTFPSNLNKELSVMYSITPDLSKKGSNIIEVRVKN